MKSRYLFEQRSLVFAVVVIVLFCLFGFRVHQVNSKSSTYRVETHKIGELVELNGAFAEYATENTNGFSFLIQSAELMSVNEYVSQYAKSDDISNNPLDSTDLNAKTLVVLEIVIRNQKSEEAERGYLDSLGWSVIPSAHKERWLRVDSTLFNLSVPQLEGAFQLSVRPGTEFTVYVPFSTTVLDKFPAQSSMSHRPTLDSGSYDFIATNLPVRHVVKVRV